MVPCPNPNTMRLSWPVVFADADADSWKAEFQRISRCRRVISETLFLAALSPLHSGHAKAIHKLNMTEETGSTFQEMRTGVIAEFKEEGDCSGLIAQHDLIQNPLTVYQCLSRLLEANEMTTSRLI